MSYLALESVVPGDRQVEQRVSHGGPGVHGDDDGVHAAPQEQLHLHRGLAGAQPGHQVQQVSYDPEDLDTFIFQCFFMKFNPFYDILVICFWYFDTFE